MLELVEHGIIKQLRPESSAKRNIKSSKEIWLDKEKEKG